MEKSITREELCIDKLRHIYRMAGRMTMDIAVIARGHSVFFLPDKDYAEAGCVIKELCACHVLDLFADSDGKTVNVYIKA